MTAYQISHCEIKKKTLQMTPTLSLTKTHSAADILPSELDDMEDDQLNHLSTPSSSLIVSLPSYLSLTPLC